MMLSLAICDDNEIQRDMLKEVLNEYISDRGRNIQLKEFEDGESLIKSVRDEGRCDIYILDMILPGMNGLEVASTLRMLKDEGKIIFLTSTVEYAVTSYDVDTFYYMVKPLDAQKLFYILDKAVNTLAIEEPYLLIKNNNQEVKLFYNKIMYVDLQKRCLCYHTCNGETFFSKTIRSTFKEATEALNADPNFVPCGVSMLVNKRFVDAVDSESLLFKNGTLLYPAKSGLADLRRQFTFRI